VASIPSASAATSSTKKEARSTPAQLAATITIPVWPRRYRNMVPHGRAHAHCTGPEKKLATIKEQRIVRLR